MISRYGIFCKVMETGSFTRTAEAVGYSQSAVSQSVKSLEADLGVTLFHRRKGGLTLTRDGEQFASYIQSVYAAEQALERKRQEVAGLEKAEIHIAETTSVSRSFLPRVIKEFKEKHPSVTFVLHHGFYTEVAQWVTDGTADIGFSNALEAPLLQKKILFQDEMMAVMPYDHPLTALDEVPLSELAEYPYILLHDKRSLEPLLLREFQKRGLNPRIEYRMGDDDSILTMVQQGLGISALYQLFLYSTCPDLAVRPIREHPYRDFSMICSNWDTLSPAAKQFTAYVEKRTPFLIQELKEHAQKSNPQIR
ncbi:MAG: LysR family transcriptional regulator [Emergencia sp.]